MYTVFTTKQFDKRLNGLTVSWQQRMMKKLHEVAAAPYAKHPNVTKLQGRAGYRLRVGDWRIVYVLEDERLILMAMEIDTRGGIY